MLISLIMNGNVLILLCFLMTSGLLRAESSALEVFHSIPNGEPAIYNVFGGQSVELPLAIDGSRLGQGKVQLSADLFQKAQTLLAPLRKNILVKDAIVIDGTSQLNQLLKWSLAIPDVKRECQMLLRLRLKKDDAKWESACDVLLNVYPKDAATEDLRRIAALKAIHLFGGAMHFRDFLLAKKIRIADEGRDITAIPTQPDPKGVYIGTATSTQLGGWLLDHPEWAGTLVVFCSDGDLLPGVFISGNHGARVAKVTLPIMNSLASDPRSQATLVEILNSVIHQ